MKKQIFVYKRSLLKCYQEKGKTLKHRSHHKAEWMSLKISHYTMQAHKSPSHWTLNS